MALNSSTEWDVRTTGNDNNGGGFNVGASGTDYSQQDTPQIVYTDLVIGVTTTQLTSVANPFTAAHVGNIINVTGGVGFTAGRYQVSSVAGVTATMDRAVGTASSTGGTGNLGGALANVATPIAAIMGSGNVIHLKAGTYTYTTTQNWGGTSGFWWFHVIGYGTTHYDGGTRPLVTTATSSLQLISLTSVSGAPIIANINFSNTAGVRGSAFWNNSGSNVASPFFVDCTFTGFSSAVNGTLVSAFNTITLTRCELASCTSHGVNNTSGSPITLINCYAHDNAGYAVRLASSTQAAIVNLSRCLITNNQGALTFGSGGPQAYLDNCTVYGSTSSAFAFSGANPSILCLQNNIIYGSAVWGVLSSTVSVPNKIVGRKNAWGANLSGDVSGYTKSSTDFSLTANPFTNPAGGDYSLNATAGGGALCRGAGSQWGS
jgi:hypothetical protein